MLRKVANATEALLRTWNLVIKKIGVSIPAQWTLEFDDVLRGLMVDVFGVPSLTVQLVTETEAVAYLLFRRCPEIDPEGLHSTVVFLDFGGHNMVGAVHLQPLIDFLLPI